MHLPQYFLNALLALVLFQDKVGISSTLHLKLLLGVCQKVKPRIITCICYTAYHIVLQIISNIKYSFIKSRHSGQGSHKKIGMENTIFQGCWGSSVTSQVKCLRDFANDYSVPVENNITLVSKAIAFYSNFRVSDFQNFFPNAQPCGLFDNTFTI